VDWSTNQISYIQSTFWPLKNESSASITTPVIVLQFSFAYFSARSARRQGRWIVICWGLSEQEIGLEWLFMWFPFTLVDLDLLGNATLMLAIVLGVKNWA